jgi:mannose-6-phosphate isomerase-like protein (cupin superfamily)
MIISKITAPHYQWGNNCDAWTLFQSDKAIVKEEEMPPNSEESLHIHENTEQFFYILEGEAEFIVGHELFVLRAGNAIAIKSGNPHKIANRSSQKLHFLVCSFPGNLSDRIEL